MPHDKKDTEKTKLAASSPASYCDYQQLQKCLKENNGDRSKCLKEWNAFSSTCNKKNPTP
ncbi:hypothetical protein DSO57_1010755 [Entomophthora muscae]|uniref:Uncharacterized protein n=1 Tax=Entomophthora muscae TaxID=34485 RepID=A0ACC2THH4_9FUNG|nr:hypothetical protein DSO57_1010755 [Entomophthora muscae]